MSSREIDEVLRSTALPLLSRRLGLIAEGDFSPEMARYYLLL